MTTLIIAHLQPSSDNTPILTHTPLRIHSREPGATSHVPSPQAGIITIKFWTPHRTGTIVLRTKPASGHNHTIHLLPPQMGIHRVLRTKPASGHNHSSHYYSTSTSAFIALFERSNYQFQPTHKPFNTPYHSYI